MEGYGQVRGSNFKFTAEQFSDLQKRVSFMIDFLSNNKNYEILRNTVPHLDDIIQNYVNAGSILRENKDLFISRPGNTLETANKIPIYDQVCNALWIAVGYSAEGLTNGIWHATGSKESCAVANQMTRWNGFYLNNLIEDLNTIKYYFNPQMYQWQKPIQYPQEIFDEQNLADAYFASLPSVTAPEPQQAATSDFIDVANDNSMGFDYSTMLAQFLRVERIMRRNIFYQYFAKDLHSVISVMQKNLPLFSTPAQNDGDVLQRLQVLRSITGFAKHLVKNKDNDSTLFSTADTGTQEAELQYLTQQLAAGMNAAISQQNAISDAVKMKYSGAPEQLQKIPSPKFNKPHIITTMLNNAASSETAFNTGTINGLLSLKFDEDLLRTDTSPAAQEIVTKQQKFYDTLNKYQRYLEKAVEPISEEVRCKNLKKLSNQFSELVNTIDQNFDFLQGDVGTMREISELRFAVNEINKQIIDKEIKKLDGNGIDVSELNSTKSILGVDLENVPQLPASPLFFSFKLAYVKQMDSDLSNLKKIIDGFACFDAQKTKSAEKLSAGAEKLRKLLKDNDKLFTQQWADEENAQQHYEAVNEAIRCLKNLRQDGENFLSSYYVPKEDKMVETAINSMQGLFLKLQKDSDELRKKFSFPGNDGIDNISFDELKCKTLPTHDFDDDEKKFSPINENQKKTIEVLKKRKWLYTDSKHREFQKCIEDGICEALNYARNNYLGVTNKERFREIASQLLVVYNKLETNPIGSLGENSNDSDLLNAAAELDRFPSNSDINSIYKMISQISKNHPYRGKLLQRMIEINNFCDIIRKDRQVLQPLNSSSSDNKITDFRIPDFIKNGKKEGSDVKDISPTSYKPAETETMNPDDAEFFKDKKFHTTPKSCAMLYEHYQYGASYLLKQLPECKNTAERSAIMKAAHSMLEIANHLIASEDLFKDTPQSSTDLKNIEEAQKSLLFARGVYQTFDDLAEAFYGSESSAYNNFKIWIEVNQTENVLNRALADCDLMYKWHHPGKEKRYMISLYKTIQKFEEEAKKKHDEAARQEAMHNKEREEFYKFKAANENQAQWLEEKNIDLAEAEKMYRRNWLEENKPEGFFNRGDQEQVYLLLEKILTCYGNMPSANFSNNAFLKEYEEIGSYKNELYNELYRFKLREETNDKTNDIDKEIYHLRKVADMNPFIEKAQQRIKQIPTYDPGTGIINHQQAIFNDSLQRLRRYANLATKNYNYRMVYYGLSNPAEMKELPLEPQISDITNQKEELAALEEEAKGIREKQIHPDFQKKLEEQKAQDNEEGENSEEEKEDIPEDDVDDGVYENPEHAANRENEDPEHVENPENKNSEEIESKENEVPEEIENQNNGVLQDGGEEVKEDSQPPVNEEAEENVLVDEGSEEVGNSEDEKTVHVENSENENSEHVENLENKNSEEIENKENEVPEEIENQENEVTEEIENNEVVEENLENDNPEEIINRGNEILQDGGEEVKEGSQPPVNIISEGGIDFRDYDKRDADTVAEEYLNEFRRLRNELAKTDSSLSKDTEPYKNLRKFLQNTVKIMETRFPELTAEDKNQTLKTCFENIQAQITEYRKAKIGLEKLSSRQIKRLKVMNRISMLHAGYQNKISTPYTSYKLKLAEKLVNNFLVEQAPKKKAAAKKLINEKKFFQQVYELKETDAFRSYFNQCSSIEKTIKKNGASVLKDFKSWVKANNIKMPAMLTDDSAPQAENQMQMGGMH